MTKQFGYAPNARQQVTQAVPIVRKMPRIRELANCLYLRKQVGAELLIV